MTRRTQASGRGPIFAALSAAIIVFAAAPLLGQSRTQAIHFGRGTTGTMVAGTIKGEESVDYIVNARAGQHLSVLLTSANNAAYFNLIAPGEKDVAFFVGSNSDPLNHFEGPAPATGDIRIRVYLYRAAARRNEVAKFRLSVSITGGGTASQQN